MRPSVDRDQLVAVEGFLQHHHELWGRNDLSHGANAIKTDVERTECHRNAFQCRVILVTESLGFLSSPRLIQAGIRHCRSSTRASSKPSTTDIRTTPPDTGQVRMTVCHSRSGLSRRCIRWSRCSLRLLAAQWGLRCRETDAGAAKSKPAPVRLRQSLSMRSRYVSYIHALLIHALRFNRYWPAGPCCGPNEPYTLPSAVVSSFNTPTF